MPNEHAASRTPDISDMATSEATDQASHASARTWRTRLRGYLARRTRQFLRVLLVFVIGLLFLAGALEGWRGAHLIGLPDIADPFDVAAFRSLRIPRDQDAFVLFRQAEQKLTRMPGLPSAVLRLGPVVPWPKVAPELRLRESAKKLTSSTYRLLME
jgi:hypothetical protein